MSPEISGRFQAGRDGDRDSVGACAHCAEPLAGMRVVSRNVGGELTQFCYLRAE
jgi:hypothetical protein